MRIFENFPKNVICPICGNNNDAVTTLIPIQGTKDGHTVEAIPTHVDCILQNLEYSHDLGVMGLEAQYKQENEEHVRQEG